MKKIVYKTETGIAVIHPTKEGLLKFGSIEKIAEKDIPRVLPSDKQDLWDNGKMLMAEYITFPFPDYKIVDESEIPTDRTFRGAWDYDLKEDIPKAKEIWKDKLRVDREPLFIENDLLLRDASLENDQSKLNNGIAERDRLRDITLLVDTANTIDEIKAVSV
jgi:hypothetical protein